MLAHLLEQAVAGDKILVVGFGQGADALLFEVTGSIGDTGSVGDVGNFSDLLSLMETGNTDLSDVSDIGDVQLVVNNASTLGASPHR